MPVILIVEDEREIRELIYWLLSPEHTVIMACNGIEGLQMFEDHRPDLVITDYQMPQMSGVELISSIRAQGIKTKIIAISACFNENPQIVEIFLAAGASFCLKKPQDFAQIDQYINQLLEQEVSS